VDRTLRIERQVVVEVKSIDALASIHIAQLLPCLCFSRVRLGCLINFDSVLIKNGIRRLVV
jgi:GxxExxY protein